MKRLAMVGALVAALVMSVVGGIVYAGHSNSATSMVLKDYEFHYLGQTLSWGNTLTVSLSALPAAPFTINIANEGKKTHIVEFEKLNVTPEVEFKSQRIPGGKAGSLTVTLDAGTWKVYCDMPLHDTKHGMVFTLVVTTP